MSNKNYCPIHHLYYTGNECPMCLKERLDYYNKKYGTKKQEEKPEVDREINKNDINRLLDKFNVK